MDWYESIFVKEKCPLTHLLNESSSSFSKCIFSNISLYIPRHPLEFYKALRILL